MFLDEIEKQSVSIVTLKPSLMGRCGREDDCYCDRESCSCDGDYRSPEECGCDHQDGCRCDEN